jgi:hypothetical protein
MACTINDDNNDDNNKDDNENNKDNDDKTMTMTEEEGGGNDDGAHNNQQTMGAWFAPFGQISNNSQLQKQWFVADEDNTIHWGRLACAHFVLLLSALAPHRLVHGFAHNVRFQKSSQCHGLWNLDTSGGLEDLHGRFDLLLTCGTIL